MTSKRTALLTVLLPLLAAPLACGGQDKVDIGSNGGGQLSDYAASWEGYAEAYQFDGESNRIRLVLDADGEGTLEVGDAPLLPPATNPDVGYPEGRSLYYQAVLYPAGFRFPVHDAHVESRRIRLGIARADLYSAWCQLQTPVLDAVNSTAAEPVYSCLPNNGFEQGETDCKLLEPPPSMAKTPVDCEKLALCTVTMACYCTASGCTASPQLGTAMIDAALETGPNGVTLNGTLAFAIDGVNRVNVRFSRQ